MCTVTMSRHIYNIVFRDINLPVSFMANHMGYNSYHGEKEEEDLFTQKMTQKTRPL